MRKNFHHHELDIRDQRGVDSLLETLRPALIVHTAAQPSHDLAASRPFDDFAVNANGTLNLLEATRRHNSLFGSFHVRYRLPVEVGLFIFAGTTLRPVVESVWKRWVCSYSN